MSEKQKPAESPQASDASQAQQTSGAPTGVASNNDAPPPAVARAQIPPGSPAPEVEAFDGRAQLVVIHPLSPTLEKVKTILGQNGDAALTEAGSTSVAVQVGAMLKPCVLMAGIQNAQDVSKILQMATLLKNDLKKGVIKCVIISKIKDSKIIAQLEKLGINEIIIEPIPDRQLQFKIGLQVKANKAARKKQKSNDLKKITSAKDQAADGGTKLNGDQNDSGVKERAADEVEEDSWLFKNNKPAKKGSKWAFRLEGPDPTEGEWQKMPDATDGESQWRFMPKNPEDAKKGAWQHKGERPEFDGNNGWNFRGINPDLSFVDAEGNKKATKVSVDEEGNIVATKDSSVAQQKALEKEQKKELEKQEKLNALKTTHNKSTKEAPRPKTDDEIDTDKATDKDVVEAKPKNKDDADNDDDDNTEEEDSDRGGALSNLKTKKPRDDKDPKSSGSADDEDEGDSGDDAEDLDGNGKNFLKKKKDKSEAKTNSDDDSDEDDVSESNDNDIDKKIKENAAKKQAAKDKSSEKADDDNAEDDDDAEDLDGSGKNFLKKKPTDKKSAKADEDAETADAEEKTKDEAAAKQEKKIQDMKKMLESLEKMADKLPPDKKEKLADFRNKLKEEEEKLSQFRGLIDSNALEDDDEDEKDDDAPTEEEVKKEDGRGESPAEAVEDEDDDDDAEDLDGSGKNFLKKKKSKDASAGNTDDDAEDEDADDLGGDGKNFLKKKRENPFAGGKMDEELAESHGQVTDEMIGAKNKWGAKDSEQGQDPEGEDHLNIESQRGNSYKAKTSEETFKEYPLPHFGSPDGIWENAGADDRKPGDQKVFIFILPEVSMKQVADVTKLGAYWLSTERPLRSEKKEAWLFKESTPEKIEDFEKLPVQAQRLLLSYAPEQMKDKFAELEERIKKREEEIENEKLESESEKADALSAIEDKIKKRKQETDDDGIDEEIKTEKSDDDTSSKDKASDEAEDVAKNDADDDADDEVESKTDHKAEHVDKDDAPDDVAAESKEDTDDEEMLSAFDKASKGVKVPPAELVTPDESKATAPKPLVRPKALSFVLSMSELAINQQTTQEQAYDRYTELMSAAFTGAAVSIFAVAKDGAVRCVFSRAARGSVAAPFVVSVEPLSVTPQLVTTALNEGGIKSATTEGASTLEFAIGIPHDHGGYAGVVLVSGATTAPDQLAVDMKYLKVTAQCVRGFLLAASTVVSTTDSQSQAA